MDFIDSTFAPSTLANNELPAGVLTNLVSQGIIPGIGGILIFIPQIAFLFLFISL
jgi:ferrous iron transport protein B